MNSENLQIKKVQKDLLRAFSRKARHFALCGGTALEFYYLHHRFSADLDFFSPNYDLSEIEEIIREFKRIKFKVKLESELFTSGRARLRFYSAFVKGLARPLKIDFVEDTIFKKPDIKKIKGVPVYSEENIYLQKIIAIVGTNPEIDEVGRQVLQGRREARDAFDIYMLSKKVRPLHIFIGNLPSQLQRGIVYWCRTFSRQDLKLALLDLDIYDKKFNPKEMIIYLEDEIKKLIKEVLKE